ncbi:hypothetical protein AA313_de0204116 [Arthrobotrys entomopaga]|nr:hypothetical protein AA313_de0204116 [Arthrobotrys entomopaga]
MSRNIKEYTQPFLLQSDIKLRGTPNTGTHLVPYVVLFYQSGGGPNAVISSQAMGNYQGIIDAAYQNQANEGSIVFVKVDISQHPNFVNSFKLSFSAGWLIWGLTPNSLTPSASIDASLDSATARRQLMDRISDALKPPAPPCNPGPAVTTTVTVSQFITMPGYTTTVYGPYPTDMDGMPTSTDTYTSDPTETADPGTDGDTPAGRRRWIAQRENMGYNPRYFRRGPIPSIDLRRVPRR